MIDKINLGNVNSNNTPYKKQGKFMSDSQTSFGGFGEMANTALQTVGQGLIKGVQYCEKYPMVNVSVLDLSTAIVPRTIIETKESNAYAGMEAFRRESSGLIVNCIIPSFIVWGLAAAMKKPVMGTFGNAALSKVWANSDTLDVINEYYTKAEGSGKQKVRNTIVNIFNSLEGADGDFTKDGKKSFKAMYEASPEKFDKHFDDMADALFDGKKINAKKLTKAIKAIVKETNIDENVKFLGKDKFFSNSFSSLFGEGLRVVKGAMQAGIADADAGVFSEYISKAKKLVKYKSLAGLGVILPLAISMQPINRWLTERSSGIKGAPIYKDYAKNDVTAEKNNSIKENSNNSNVKKDSNEAAALLKQKFISIGSMVGVCLLSMMKLPTAKMLEFKGIFPSMDQARIISTATFASRMGAADDKNELREATVRDIATFSSFYFLGDYAAKGIASCIERLGIKDEDGKAVKLINRLRNPKENANSLQKFWSWVKDTSLKASDELATGKAKNLRTVCQLGNIAFSLISLGVFIPLYTRTTTNKKREAELAAAAAENAKAAQGFTRELIKNDSPAFQSFFQT